jgi:hypothetical protein
VKRERQKANNSKELASVTKEATVLRGTWRKGVDNKNFIFHIIFLKRSNTMLP